MDHTMVLRILCIIRKGSISFFINPSVREKYHELASKSLKRMKLRRQVLCEAITVPRESTAAKEVGITHTLQRAKSLCHAFLFFCCKCSSVHNAKIFQGISTPLQKNWTHFVV